MSDPLNFEWPIRVYYEDTDAGGIVFYANYLKFFERARTEWLRACGIDQQKLAESDGIVFVVRRTSVDSSPARLDDVIRVVSRIDGWVARRWIFTRKRGAAMYCSRAAIFVSRLWAVHRFVRPAFPTRCSKD